MDFKLASPYKPPETRAAPSSRSPAALYDGEKHQVLLGVTGSGKTFTMAKVIEQMNRPALVLAHNKTLAAQLYHEFKSFFPHNAVEYFVSLLRLLPARSLHSRRRRLHREGSDRSTTSSTSCGCRRRESLFERRDCIIVASVSCIYGLGSPEAYYGMLLFLEKGQKIKREDIVRKLVEILYERTEGDFRRGTFRVRGDVIEIFPTYDDNAYRIELWGDEVESLSQIDPLFGTVKQKYARLPIYPKTHYVMKPERKNAAVDIDPGRADVVGSRTGEAGPHRGGAARASAHAVRSRDDQGDGLLPRHRELLAPLHRTPAGRAAADAAGLCAARFPAVHRRVAPDGSAAARHVARRPLAQAEPDRVRIPAAERARQSAADVRGVRASREPGDLRFGDARAVRADQIGRRGGRADHPARPD